MDPNPGQQPGGPPSASSDKLRPLLPALAPRNPSSAAGPSLISSQYQLTARRRRGPAACAACRKRRIKCGGQRPRCHACASRNEPECSYDGEADETTAQAIKRKYGELQDHVDSHQKVIRALRSHPEDDAQAILARIRRGDDIDTIARHVDYGDLLLQVSLQPETRYRYVFPVHADMPAYLVKSSSPYLHSLLYDWTVGGAAGNASASASAPDMSLDMYMKPYHAAEVIDAQLGAVQPSKWTSVCRDDEMMRRLLRAYFLQEYGTLTAFRKDDFLEDMAQERHRLCSPLLAKRGTRHGLRE